MHLPAGTGHQKEERKLLLSLKILIYQSHLKNFALIQFQIF